MTYRNGARVGLAVDGDFLDVTVGGGSGSKSQCRNGDGKDVLSERRVVHCDS